MKTITVRILILSMLICNLPLYGQQIVDASFEAEITDPAFEYGKGPLILLDEAHNNGAKLNTAFHPLSKGLLKDGYRIKTLQKSVDTEILKSIDILVIVDALSSLNIDHWELPTPSAFTDREILAIAQWIREGGSLFLVADHMPFAGAASKLAQTFKIEFLNGFAIDTLGWDVTQFNRKDNSLLNHAIVRGRNENEQIDKVISYFGQCFTTSDIEMVPILEFKDENVVSYQPKKAWRFDENSTMLPAKGYYQGLAGNFGKGRIVVLGDSGLISAHLIGKESRPIGMNAPNAEDNFQFALNIFHWLSKKLD